MKETNSNQDRPMGNENVLRLLIIEDTLNDAELMIRILRNSGYSVRQATPDNPDELVSILQTHPIDLAICSAASRRPSLEQVRDAIETSGKDIPLIAFAADHNLEMQLEIMQIGASDLVCKNELEHLRLVVRRELTSLEIRRKLEVSERLIQESETRCRALLDSSRDAIAYVHDGMHIHANAAYLDMFGFESLEEIASTPVMDMVAPEDHAKFKEFLRHYRGGEQGAQELQILGLRLDGTEFNATMTFIPAAIESEPCTQIIIREVISAAELGYEAGAQQEADPLRLFNPAVSQKAAEERDQHWIDLIRDALGNDRFTLVYQPIASLHHDTSEKYEVLIRMTDEEDKEILPQQFLPVAEKHDLITAVDRWVILNAVKTLRELRRTKRDAMFFINVSQASIEDEKLLPWFSKLLQKARVPGDRLVFELSEQAVVNQLRGIKTFLQGLQALSCSFCLERFGNSEHSLQLLKHFPATYLKIDAAIIQDLAHSEHNQALLDSIVQSAHSKGKMTIAQNVEDADSLALLWKIGIDYIQGHFLQQPNATMNFDFKGGGNR